MSRVDPCGHGLHPALLPQTPLTGLINSAWLGRAVAKAPKGLILSSRVSGGCQWCLSLGSAMVPAASRVIHSQLHLSCTGTNVQAGARPMLPC